MKTVFLNNKLVDADKATVSITDGGLLYGAGLFETMRCFGGVVFRLEDHLGRLFTSCQALSIETGYDHKYITEAVYKVLEANKLSDARLRLTLTAGSMSHEQEKPQATLLITAAEFQPYPAEYYKNGVMVALCGYRQNIADPLCGHKTTNYFSRMIALDQARQKRTAEALWFTTDNRLAEGCISNVFLVKNSVLYTPSAKTPVLPGVARKTVCELAKEHSIELIEKDLFIDDLLGADEVFLTNVIMQILPVSRIEKHSVGGGQVGPVTKDLQKYFDEYIKNTCSSDKSK
jgi:branched-chain amino acid aminotransferase